jgi:type II secretory pathway component PulF
MKKFIIDYITLEGDLSSVWINAYTAEEAKKQLKREYWDVQEIIMIENE